MEGGGGGETYLKSVDWDMCETEKKDRQTDRQSRKYKSRQCTPQHDNSAPLFSVPYLRGLR